ncbi:MAG: hypothetical protein GX963_05165 [Bacteroidales bacterium]|nr:hypothetical protein [Bacteroidales bacterium]
MKMDNVYRVGIDVGSTTLKIVVLNSSDEMVYKVYKRHKADFNTIFMEELTKINTEFKDAQLTLGITGSAGMGISERTGIPFVQEVVSSIEVVNKVYPETQSLIDLGGEDAKIVFFDAGRHPDIRMNGSCAGGTGAFIDQMADLMNIPLEELGQLALNYEKILPVASRCGVFAKTDVQNLMSRNIPHEDIAMSILHAVALQSITTLARGREIKPKILCIGGPLTFIPALREAFKKVLHLNDSDLILPENGEYFPAWGTALNEHEEKKVTNLNEIIGKLQVKSSVREEVLPPLFSSEAEYEEWKGNRGIKVLKKQPLGTKKEIACFLGIDSGSTTTKILILNEDAEIVFSFYGSNQGNSLRKVVEGLNQFKQEAKRQGVTYRFLGSAATGYGEDLIKSALNLDFGIVETIAHLSGAQYVDPEVSFVLDIGGQDMKSIFTRNGVISNVELNEACSSGCGSFLQNFASTMNMSLDKFTKIACSSEYPSDLGSRCTVFMNSKIKQSLRENASLNDISAGLAYSVIRNCLFKVLKVENLNALGNHIVVQGGTFRNDAVYRALELLSGKKVSSTDMPELMGAFGAALYAAKMWKNAPYETRFTGAEELPDVEHIKTRELQCKGCTNTCSILRFTFDNGNVCYAGNKCEKIFYNKQTAPAKGYNAFELKNEILFNRKSEKTPEIKGKIGIPRVLNMYENYPFWHTLLSNCGFEVVLSPESTYSMYRKGVGYVMSDNICFPAKVVHGHILALAEMGVDRIFYPMVIKEAREFEDTSNTFNCPVVSGYPDVIQSSMNPEEQYGIPLDKPVITFSDDKALRAACLKYVSSFGVSPSDFNRAFDLAVQEQNRTEYQLKVMQEKVLTESLAKNKLVFIVACRPYHADPLIHHKAGQVLSDLGVNVLTEDVFRESSLTHFSSLNMVSQWSYPNRVSQAAMEVAALPQNVQLVQLNSFGCGPDSFLMDEVGALLKDANKNHTILRIDEIASPGSMRLRLRSLIESMRVMKSNASLCNGGCSCYKGYETIYDETDRRKTILAPWFADFLSPFIPAVGELAGYKIVNLPKPNRESVDVGLKYSHNELCYPATIIIGDIIKGLQSGNYDLNEVVVAITQTGGQCRATNYVSQIKGAMTNAGFSDIPVIVAAIGDVYQNEQKAFKVPVLRIINILIYTLLYADALQQMYSLTQVREKNKGDSQRIFDLYVDLGVEAIKKNDSKVLLQLLEQAVLDFNAIAIYDKEYKKVGFIGEIYLKYNNFGQAHLREWLQSKGMVVVTPPALDFAMQYFVNSKVNVENGLEREGLLKKVLNPLLLKWMNKKIQKVEDIVKDFRFHTPYESIFKKAEYASEILDLSNQFGEGWAIAGEVASFVREGIDRVVCVQPFGCIANHIVAKGIEKRLKKFYPDLNILYLDIDGGMAEVNLQNRLHFLIN